MTSLLSKPAQYAIRALVDIARLPASQSATLHSIAERQDIPRQFLAKVMRRLADANLVESFRGPGGGFRLALPPHRIDVLTVVLAIDTDAALESCVLGLAECGGAEPCAMHDRWGPLRDKLKRELERTTIAALAEGKTL
jgi:Rrf2 family protein